MKLDDILTEIGDFGKFQRKNYVLLLFAWIVSIPFLVMSVFILAVPEHRCKIPGYDNDSYEVQGPYHGKLISHRIPPSTKEGKIYDECHVYHTNKSFTIYDNNSRPINTSITECSSWVYSNELFENTFVMEVDIVCGESYKTSLSKTIYFGGVLLGSFMFGMISDILGRRKALLIAVLFLFASSMSLAWANSYTTFVILRFCTGVGTVGMFLTSYVMGMEWVGPSKRTIAGLVIALIGPSGQLYLILMSYLTRRWNFIIISLAVPVGLYGFVWWFIPESPRWLCSKGRLKEASSLLQQAARVNKKDFSEKMLAKLDTEKKQEAGRLWLLFSNKPLAFRTIVLFYNWMVASMVFYGLSLNTGRLYGNFYINFLINVLVEYPGHIMPLLMMDRFGRRKSHFLYMAIGGLACLSTIFTVNFGGKDIQPVTTTLAMIGKMFSTAAFASIYVFSAELYPTVVRNAGMGASSCWARVGGMVSPFIADIADLVPGKVGKAAPMVIFGGACLIAAGLTLTLPETLHQHLPETIQDGKNYATKEYRQKSRESLYRNQTITIEKS